jgi:hypothetical protein
MALETFRFRRSGGTGDEFSDTLDAIRVRSNRLRWGSGRTETNLWEAFVGNNAIIPHPIEKSAKATDASSAPR